MRTGAPEIPRRALDLLDLISMTPSYHATGPVERRKRVTFYDCTTRRKLGPCICSNRVVLPQHIVDSVVLEPVGGVLDSPIPG